MGLNAAFEDKMVYWSVDSVMHKALYYYVIMIIGDFNNAFQWWFDVIVRPQWLGTIPRQVYLSIR